MSKLTDQFGTLVSFYKGSGTINQEACEFEIGQTANGAIVIYVDKFLQQMRQAIELKGTVEDGRVLVAEGDVRRIEDISSTECFLHSSPPFHSSDPFHFTVGELACADAVQVKFAITNLLFRGNDADSNSWMTGIGRLNVELDGTKVSFEKDENYTDLLNPVGSGDSTEVTCSLITEVSGKSKEEVLKFALDICDLLTIGTGRKICWINYTVSDASGSDVYSYYQYRFTDKRTGRELIDFRNGGHAAAFLEQCYPAYKSYDVSNPGTLHSMGLMLIDANSFGFMKTRALIIYSITDTLSYMESTHKSLRGRLRDIVDNHSVPIEKCKKKRCGRGCGTCQPKCKNCKNECEAKCEIGQFVDGRNRIVHKLQFPTDDDTKEYYAVLSFMHRLLLRMLNYDSHFVDVRYNHDPRFRTNLLRPSP